MTAALTQQAALSRICFSQAYTYSVDDFSGAERKLDVSLVPADLAQHARLLHNWMNLPHVAEFWMQAWPLPRIREYLSQQLHSYHRVLFVYVNGHPVAYTELYPVAEDTLGTFCRHGEHDWGWHLLIGPESFIGCGLSLAVGHSICQYLFTETRAESLFCEPDVRNERMQHFVQRLAHQDKGMLAFGPVTTGDWVSMKQARLMRCDRSDFTALTLPPLRYRPSLSNKNNEVLSL